MRILDVIFPSSGGETREQNLLKGLKELENEVFCCELLGSTLVNEEKVSLYSIDNHLKNNAGFSPIRAAKQERQVDLVTLEPSEQKHMINRILGETSGGELERLYAFVRDMDIDAIISGDFTITSNILVQLKKKFDVPTISLSAGHMIGLQKLRELGMDQQELIKYYSNNLSRIDQIVAPSDFESIRTSIMYNISRNKIRTVYNGIDTMSLKFLHNLDKEKVRMELSKTFGISGPYVLYLGRMDADKGIHIIPFVASILKEYTFVVVGKDTYDAPYGRTIFKKMIESYKLENINLLDYVSDEIKYKLYLGASAVIYPSTEVESFGYVPIEALYMGTPCILPNYGPFPEIFRKLPEAIFLYEPYNVNDMADKIRRAIDSTSLLDFGSVKREIERSFDLKVMSTEILSLLKSLERGGNI